MIEYLSMFAGAMLSLIASAWPGYSELDPNRKRLIMIGLLAAAALAVYGIACAGLTDAFGSPVVTCDQSGITELMRAFLMAATANQATFMLTPKRAQ